MRVFAGLWTAQVASPGLRLAPLPKEFLLLFKRLSYPGRLFTRRELMDETWGLDSESAECTVNAHVNRPRARFAVCAAFLIETVPDLAP